MKKIMLLFSLVCPISATLAQVNMQSGAAEQSFPLINYTDSKAGLSLGVSLAYSSGNGLLVSDIASDVGTGWNLDAGGIITRAQVGEPDDQQGTANGQLFNYNTPGNVLKRYPHGYLYNPDAGKGCNVGLNYFPLFRQKNAIYKDRNSDVGDVEQDRFVFRVNGRSGVFIIGRNWKATVLGDAKLKISITTADMKPQGIRTTISEFSITTEDGIKYTFRDKGLTRICRYKNSFISANGQWQPVVGETTPAPYQVNRYVGYPVDLEDKPYVVNSWYLSEVENLNTRQKITFNYQNIFNDIFTSKYISHQRDLNKSRVLPTGAPAWGFLGQPTIGNMWYRYLSNPVNADNYSFDNNLLSRTAAGPTTVVYNRSVGYTKRISSIVLPNGGTINFNYYVKERYDLPGEHALEQIVYKLNDKVIRSYRMEYGYFFRNANRDYHDQLSSYEQKFVRLYLKSLQKIGNNEDNVTEPPYRFDYYTGSYSSPDDIVPSRNFLSQDHWGYYNGSLSGLSLTEDHDFLSRPTDNYFLATLPKFKNPKAGYAKNGLLKSITYPTGGALVYTYDQIKSQVELAPGGGMNAGGVAVIKTVLSPRPGASIIKDFKYTKPGTNVSSFWGAEKPVYYSFNIAENNLKCFGGGRMRFKHTGIQYPEMASGIDAGKSLGSILGSMALSIGVSVLIHTLFAGPVVIPIFNFVSIAVAVIGLINMVMSCLDKLHYYSFYLTNSNSMMSNPLPSYFSSVEVRSNSPGDGNGKTVYEFSSPVDYPLLVPEFKWPYTQYQRYASWVYGNPKKISVYDKFGIMVSETINKYTDIVSRLSAPNVSQSEFRNDNNINCKCATINKASIRQDKWSSGEKMWYTWQSGGDMRWMVPTPYWYSTGRTDLTYTQQFQYTSNGQLYNSDVNHYISDPATLLQKGKVTATDGNSMIIEMSYYPTDYTISGGALQKLKDINAIHTPVSTERWKIARENISAGPVPIYAMLPSLVSSNVTEFATYTFGTRQEVKPWRTWRLKNTRTIPAHIIGAFNPNQLLRRPEYYKLESEMIYDNDGNLVETEQDGNITSFVNDHNDRYVTASVANASHNHIAFSSFETPDGGNWNFDPAGITGSMSVTGTNAYTINTAKTITKTGLLTSAGYVVTYWVRDEALADIRVNGQTGTLLFETGGWKLYRHIVTGSTNVSVSGSGTIDDLRLHPENALMSTVTYKEGIGKVADSDANNRVLFYEYDALGRLKLIRDQNRNVIKTFEYNYKQ